MISFTQRKTEVFVMSGYVPYDYYYDYYGSYPYGADHVALFAVGLLMAILIFSVALSVALYVFRSIGVYQIAKRREIRHPWLAWIPFGSSWIVGSISDQYQYVVKSREKSHRVILLVLSIVTAGFSVVTVVVQVNLLAFVFGEAFGVGDCGSYIPMKWGLITIPSLVLLSGASIAYAVFYYLSLYDLYSSCNPKNKVMYLVLGIVFQVTEPFFLFSCRNQDAGMPPRKSSGPVIDCL